MSARPAYQPVCAACGDRIGVFEPLWLQSSDGQIAGSTVIELNESSRAEAPSALFHIGCITPHDILRSSTPEDGECANGRAHPQRSRGEQ